MLTNPQPRPTDVTAPPPRRRVLVVDDSRLQRRILTALLQRWGYDFDEAETAEQALQICRDRPPDLVLSDWMMPGMNGIEFCQTFRKLPRESYGYFILLTSKTEKAAVAQGLDCGADDFLSKPVSGAELRARLTAGERVLQMERELSEKNRLVEQTLHELQVLHAEIESDLVEAKKLQESLVRDRHRDFGAAQLSLLLRSSRQVGGDLVGFYPINDRQFGLYAIDVSGHGISSALMTARLAGYLSSAAPEQNIALRRAPDGGFAPLPPSEVVEMLNQMVLTELETEHYFTMILADFDLQTGVVRLVQAGHPYPVLLRRDGRTEIVGSGGLPVGLLDDIRFEEFELVLQPGDRVLFHSDGFVECPNPQGEMLEMSGLTAMMQRQQQQTGLPFLDALVTELGHFAGSDRFPDDVSAILLGFSGS